MKPVQSSNSENSQSEITPIKITDGGEGEIEFIFQLDEKFHPNVLNGKPVLLGGAMKEGGEFAEWRILDKVSTKEMEIIEIARILKQLRGAAGAPYEDYIKMVERDYRYEGASIFSSDLNPKIALVKV